MFYVFAVSLCKDPTDPTDLATTSVTSASPISAEEAWDSSSKQRLHFGIPLDLEVTDAIPVECTSPPYSEASERDEHGEEMSTVCGP